MTTSLLIKKTETFEIAAFKRPENLKQLSKTHVAFSGTPRKHPHDPFKVILIVDPYCANTFYYEFNTEDIAFVEELPNLVNIDEDVIIMVRIWVRKRSVAVRCTPFRVDDTNR